MLFLSTAWSYKPVENIELETIAENIQLKTNDKLIVLTIQNQDDNKNTMSEQEIIETLEMSYRVVYTYLKERNYPTKDCRLKENLYIYTLSKENLNNRDLFYKYHIDGPTNIVGLYDRSENKYNSAVIILTEQDSFNKNVLLHEAAHYWYDRMCVDIYSRIDPETFAERMEKYAFGYVY